MTAYLNTFLIKSLGGEAICIKIGTGNLMLRFNKCQYLNKSASL